MSYSIDFRATAAGFDQPLALWHACHVRILRMAGLVERLRDYLQKNPVDNMAQTTATSIRRYFNEAAPRHHEDEEQDIFPRLRARLPVAAEPLERAMKMLEGEHEPLGVLWQTLDAALAEIEQGHAAELDEATVLLFVSGYRRHCEAEDRTIAAALERHLTPEDQKAIGRAMAARRGVDWAELTGTPL
jgi:hemerythrin-like domain-containing protein